VIPYKNQLANAEVLIRQHEKNADLEPHPSVEKLKKAKTPGDVDILAADADFAHSLNRVGTSVKAVAQALVEKGQLTLAEPEADKAKKAAAKSSKK